MLSSAKKLSFVQNFGEYLCALNPTADPPAPCSDRFQITLSKVYSRSWSNNRQTDTHTHTHTQCYDLIITTSVADFEAGPEKTLLK